MRGADHASGGLLAAGTREVLDTLDHIVSIRRLDGTVDYLNSKWFEYTGAPTSSASYSDWREFIHPEDIATVDSRISETPNLHSDSPEYEWRLRRRDGEYRWFLVRAVALPQRSPHPKRWLVTATDIHDLKRTQESLAASARELSYLAHNDPMTKLPNRRTLIEQLTREIARARRAGTGVAVLYLDLDLFKDVNDTLGHASGDLVLTEVAQRMTALLRDGDTASRVGGDEFILVCATLEGSDHATHIAKRLASALTAPIKLGHHSVTVGTSIGISLYPNDGADAETLISKADIAMYAAKAAGRNTYRVFNIETHVATVEARDLETELRSAIAKNEFVLHYQPIIDVASRSAIGAEALVRWNHRERGLLPPSEFIAVAERQNVIEQIGKIVLDAACEEIHRLQNSGNRSFVVSINVSAQEFLRDDFVETIAKAVKTYAVQPARLELEITESILLVSDPGVISTVNALRSLGVRLSIDDFGTGYSSLAYLRTFKIQKLKIDRAFVNNVARDATDQAIARAIVTLSHSLGMHVIAEGVESEDQMSELCALGVDSVQGFLFSPALPSAELERFLSNGASTPAPSRIATIRSESELRRP